MEKIRAIGNVNILVDCNLPHDIYFEEKFARKNNISSKEFSQIDICNLLSKDEFRPLYLMWEITDKCNFACPFCYIVGSSNSVTIRFDEIKNNIDYLIDKGLLYCLLTGGESTIHPDFVKIYKYLKKSGVIVEVYTNGSMITDKHLEMFSQYKPYKLEITIYGLSDTVFKKNTNSKLSPNATLSNIEKLNNLGVNVVCKTPVNSLTISELEEIREWCSQRNIKHYHSSDIAASYNGNQLTDYLAPSDIKLKYETENEANFIKNNGFPPSGKHRSCFSCAVGSYGIHINSKFELQPCSSFNGKREGYNIIELGIDESLLEMRKYVLSVHKKPILGCAGCGSSSHCKMCPALGDAVFLNGKIIGYKTNVNYCYNIKNNYNKITNKIKTENL